MNYLQKKKLTFMSIVNRVKGFIRTVTGVFPLTLANCVDEESIIDYTLYGNSVQDDTTVSEAPVGVESVGERTRNILNPSNFTGGIIVEYNGVRCYKYRDGAKSNFSYTDNFKENTRYTFTIRVYGGDNSKNTTVRFYYTDGTYNTQQIYKPNTVYRFTTTAGKTLQKIVGGDAWNIERYIDLTVTQLENGTIATGYEPYGYKIPVTVSGKNILKFSYINSALNSYAGLNITGHKDGSITINGTCTGDAQLAFSPQTPFLKSTSCRLYVTPTADDKYLVHTYNGHKATKNGVHISLLNDINKIYLKVLKGAMFDNFTIYPMMIKGGKIGEEWEPYHEPITTNIYLDEPLGAGQSINYKKDGLPPIPTFNGTSIISADTTVRPSNAEIEYYSNVKE